MLEILSDARRAALKPSFVTRRVPMRAVAGVATNAETLKPGDLVVAEVTDIGQHTRIEKPNGRRATLYPGDEILVACGARYAPDQFEAAAPTSVGPAHLAAAGGIAGLVAQAHERMKPATAITILGAAVGDTGSTLNLADFALPRAADCGTLPAIAVVGTSMNAGKTHCVTSIVRGLRAAGLKVAALKATGTGAGGDLWRQLDAGAELALDFTDVGFATTFQADPKDIELGARRLLAAATRGGADVAVVEIADGLRQVETASLLASDTLRSRWDGVVFAAGDALGAERGVHELNRLGHQVRAVSGLLSRSPLMIRETREAIEPPVLSAAELSAPDVAVRLFQPGVAQRAQMRRLTSIAGIDAAPKMEIANVA